MTKNMKMKPRPGAKPINMTKLPGTAVRRHYNLEVNRRSGANSPVSTTSIKLNSIIKQDQKQKKGQLSITVKSSENISEIDPLVDELKAEN